MEPAATDGDSIGADLVKPDCCRSTVLAGPGNQTGLLLS